MGQQSGPEGEKNAYALIWMLVGFGVVGWFVWYFFSEQFKLAFLWIRRYEALAIGYFTDGVNVATNWLYRASPEDINKDSAIKISQFIGEFLMIPAIFVLLLMALYLFKSHIAMRYTKKYSIDTLAKQEQYNWPQIAPVVDLDLIGADLGQGPWAVAMNPMQFSKHHQLLTVEMVQDRKAVWRQEGVPKATLLTEKAEQVFASQLGPLWRGPENLNPHTKALYAVFLARAEHEPEVARNYLRQLARTAAKGAIDYSETNTLLKKYGHCKAAKVCQTRHAYVYTIMASMLELGRLDGVLASADFLWLKPVDRRLWYVLNTVGRQVAPSEVAGVFSHWLAEKEMHRPLSVPMVKGAVAALDLALSTMVYVPEEGEQFVAAPS